MSSQIEALKIRLGTVSDLDGAAELAGWDQQTKMPPNGAQARADVLATLASGSAVVPPSSSTAPRS